MAVILVTGAAGFIGSHVACALLDRGDSVIGIDSLNEYYDPQLKKARLRRLLKDRKGFTFYKADIADSRKMDDIFSSHRIDKICHLAAQAGVRYSLENPFAYIRSNVQGTTVIFELARRHKVKHVVYASSSSVYGTNTKQPFSEEDRVDTPISLYAATKRSNELEAFTYHRLFGISMTGLRFFTVYGPYGRPDMAAFLFSDAILKGKELKVFNYGRMYRDFTYVSDIVDGVARALDREFPCEVFNLGCGSKVELMRFINQIEKALGKKARMKMLPLQPGDIVETYADITKAKEKLGYQPKVGVEEGVKRFVEWYRQYYRK